MAKSSILSIRSLIREAKAEKWEFVDKAIPQIINDPKYSTWAFQKGIHSSSINVRDLGASILEKADIPESRFEVMRPDLANLARKDSSYAGFRAACALAAHGPGEYTDLVLKTLRKFTKDQEIKDIAINYIRKLSLVSS